MRSRIEAVRWCARAGICVALRGVVATALVLLAVGMDALGHAQSFQLTNTTSSGPVQSFPVTQVSQSSAPQNVTLTFNDDSTLYTLQVDSASSEYTLSANMCTVGVFYSAGSSCTFSITFTPVLPGWASAPAPISRSAPLLISYYDNDLSQQVTATVALTGTGTGPVAVVTPGLISDIVGSDTAVSPPVYGGDGGPASGAFFNQPSALAVDSFGNIYIADTQNYVVRVVYKGGAVLANLIALENPGTTATAGYIYTIAGIAPASPGSFSVGGSDDVLATTAGLNLPQGVAVDAAGNIYIADTNAAAVRMVNATTGIINTVAGTYNSGCAAIYLASCAYGDQGPATSAQLDNPLGIAVDGYGNLYIADSDNEVIRVVYEGGAPLASLIATEYGGGVTATVGNIYTLAGGFVAGSGSANPGNSGDGGLASAAGFYYPTSVTVDSQGNVFIDDTSGGSLRRVDAVTGLISTASTQVVGSLAVDASDNVYAATNWNCTVMEDNPNAPSWFTTQTVAGTAGNCSASGDGGNATQSTLSGAQGVAVDGTGSLYILEPDGVRYVNASATALAFPNALLGIESTPQTVMVTDADILNYPIGGPAPATMTPLTETSGTVGLSLPSPFLVQALSGGYLFPSGTVDCGSTALSLTPGQLCGIGISMQSSQDGPASGVASYSDNSISFAGAPLTFNLTANVIGAPPTVSLGTVAPLYAVPGGPPSTPQTLTLTNLSTTTPLAITSISATAGFAAVSSCGITLAASSSCTISVTYSASATGIQTGSIQIFDDASTGSGEQQAAVTGNGMYPTATLTPSTLSFTAIENEGTAAPQPATLTNTSLVPLTITSITPAQYTVGDFQQQANSTCGSSFPATLAAGAQCVINITYATNAAATETQTLTVTDNATSGGGTQTALLSGSGIVPIATVTPSSINFGTIAPGASSPATLVTIQNTGTAPLTFCTAYPACTFSNTGLSGVPANITGSEADKFTVDYSGCAGPPYNGQLPVGASCTMNVYFSPPANAVGYYGATLNIYDDSGGEVLARGKMATQTVGLIGNTSEVTVGNPLSVTALGTTAPATAVGQSQVQNVQVQLSTVAGITSIAIPSSFSEFSISAISGCAVDGSTANPAGTICTVAVTFAPTAPGVRHAQLIVTLTGGSAGIPYLFSLSGIGLGPLAALTPGMITEVVGGGIGTGFGGIGGPANQAQIGYLAGMALDSQGDIFLSDDGNNVVWKIDTSGVINLYVGRSGVNGSSQANGDGGPALGAILYEAGSLATDALGGLYIGDHYGVGNPWNEFWDFNGRIRYVNPLTGIITTIAGNGSGTCGGAQTDIWGDGCPAVDAVVESVSGIALDSAGNIYFTDNHEYQALGPDDTELTTSTIRRIDAKTGIITIYAGGGNSGISGNGGPATSAAIVPTDLAFDSSDNLYLAEVGDVRMIGGPSSANPGFISLVAGNGTGGANPNRTSGNQCTGNVGDGGLATAALFNSLNGVAIDAAGNIYTTDTWACTVRRIDAGTGMINDVAGGAYPWAYLANQGVVGENNADGSSLAAAIPLPMLTRLDAYGNLYIAQEINGVQKVDVSQSVMDFNRAFTSSLGYADFDIPIDSAGPLPITTTVVNAGNSGYVQFENPFLLPPSWGIGSTNWTRDVTNPTGGADCYDAQTINPGYECPISTDFTPLVGGPLTGLTTINDNAANAPQTITLLGTASATQANVTLMPFLLNFSTPQNSTSPQQTLTLTNNGTAAVSGIAVSITGSGAAAFSQSSNCPATLSAGASCSIWVVFSPPIVSGNYVNAPPPDILTAQVSVTDSDPSAPQIANLIGTGTLPAAAPMTASLSIAETIHVSDSPSVVTPIPLNIVETIHTTDTPSVILPAMLNIREIIHTTDSLPSITPSMQIAINEQIHVADAITPVPVPLTTTISWSTPAPITYGSTLSAALNASALQGGKPVAGSYAYTATPTGEDATEVTGTTVLGAGSYTLSVTFTPWDTTDYTTATKSVNLSVTKLTPTITWATPASINYGTALSATQLDATANTGGTFVYTPALGTVPAPGTQTLSVTFTPADAVDYSAKTTTVSLLVVKPAVLTSPTPNVGTVLSTNPTFAWSGGVGVTYYKLCLGTTGVGSGNLYNSGSLAATASGVTVTGSGVPSNALTVYARLYSYINGAWQSRDYTYKESGTPTPAALTSPTPNVGTVLSTNPTFAWSGGIGVTYYKLYLGTTGVGSSNLYNSGDLAATASGVTVTGSGVPSNALTVYARLYSYINGAWQSSDYTYKESGTPTPAALTSPTPNVGTVLSTNPTFAWSGGVGVIYYKLCLGTTGVGSGNLYNSGSLAATATGVTVTGPGVPSNALTVYARLYSYINGAWQSNDYTYKESGTPTPAALTSPTPNVGTVLSTNPTFAWSGGVGVIYYKLCLGTTGVGSSNLYNSGNLAATVTGVTVTGPGVPSNALTVYARLYSYINGAWQSRDYTYKESN